VLEVFLFPLCRFVWPVVVVRSLVESFPSSNSLKLVNSNSSKLSRALLELSHTQFVSRTLSSVCVFVCLFIRLSVCPVEKSLQFLLLPFCCCLFCIVFLCCVVLFVLFLSLSYAYSYPRARSSSCAQIRSRDRSVARNPHQPHTDQCGVAHHGTVHRKGARSSLVYLPGALLCAWLPYSLSGGRVLFLSTTTPVSLLIDISGWW
jgi:hypothetical protein